MEIRRLIEQDLPALAELYTQFWGESSSLEKMGATFQRIEQNPQYIVLVAEDGGRLAGSLMGIVCDELYGNARPFLVIEDVIVDKDHRRAGVGSALMREMERNAVENDCHYIIFVTEASRASAHSFYESLGYKADGYKGFKKRL